MKEVDKGCPMTRMGVSGWMFLLVPAYPGRPGPMAVRRLCVCVVWMTFLPLNQQHQRPEGKLYRHITDLYKISTSQGNSDMADKFTTTYIKFLQDSVYQKLLMAYFWQTDTHTHKPHTHVHLTALCPRLPGWASTRKVKPIWISLKQETVSGSGISKSAPSSRQITTLAPHHSVFYRPDALPANQPTASKHWMQIIQTYRRAYMRSAFHTVIRWHYQVWWTNSRPHRPSFFKILSAKNY